MIGPNGDGKSAVATPNGRNRMKNKENLDNQLIIQIIFHAFMFP